MTSDLIAIAVIAAPVAVCLFLEWWYWHRRKVLIDHELHLRAQKREFLEALLLAEYGATEEAHALLQSSKLFEDAK